MEGDKSLPADAPDDSEAETLIDSPAKKKEGVNAQKSRIGSLPVPNDDDDNDSLSSADSSAPSSMDSSRSRAMSEKPTGSLPKKRKHRASSVDNLPSSKRRSMEPQRRLRGMDADNDAGKMRSSSPPSRGHRRAKSTQSALEGASDASSDTRPQRGIGRSTSTLGGRPGGREHKRQINKYGFTKFAEACEAADMDLVKEWRVKDPEQLEIAEYAGNKPLQIAALKGNAEVVAYLIQEGAQIDCANVDKDTPLIDAAENGHLEVVKLLLDAGVDPLRQNMKGQQALDVITDEIEDATRIRAALHSAIEEWNSHSAQQRRQDEEESRHSRITSKELHFMSRTYGNLIKLVQNNDRTGVQEFLAARVPVDNRVIAAAAKTGDVYLVNMLLAEMNEKKRKQKPEEPMLAVLGSSHFEMVQLLTELEWFDPSWTDSRGKGWVELIEEKQGPMWRQERELLKNLKEKAGESKERRSSSPITKKDGGVRRKLTQRRTLQEDDSEDDVNYDAIPGSKANGKRRLMNRSNVKPSKGLTAVSDDEEDGGKSSDEDAPGEREEGDFQPPNTPSAGTRRRLRSKSQSGSPEVPTKNLRKKRSNSFREGAMGAGGVMPTVDEEEASNTASSNIDVAASSTAAEKARQDREEEAMLALDLAKKAEEKRKEEEAAEAEAKRAQEEAERKAEEERKVEEARLAEEARIEEEKRAEQEKKEAEDKAVREKERQRQREEQKIKYRSEILETLPEVIGKWLDPDRVDCSKDELKNEQKICKLFSRLRVIITDEPGGKFQNWVLNTQAAALVKDGLDLFFHPDSPDYEFSLATKWKTSEMEKTDWNELSVQWGRMEFIEQPEVDLDTITFQHKLNRANERYNAPIIAKNKLTAEDSKAVVRKVRLEDVVANLHPGFIEEWTKKQQVGFVNTTTPLQREMVQRQLEIQNKTDFVGRMSEFWRHAPARGTVEEVANGTNRRTEPVVNTVKVTVVHAK